MKKLTLIVSAIALLIGFSQCKKEVITPNTTDQGIHITLNAGYGQNGQRTDFNPAGSFVWTNDATEYVYVGGANHSGCIGVLSGTGNGTATMTFTGGLTTTPNDGELLYFFYLGKGRDGSPVNTLDFSSQDGTLENVTNYHIAIGSEEYTTGQTSFSATLDMAMAIAYFDLSEFGSGNIYLNGEDVYSTATINYTSGSISGNSKGFINVGTADSKYVALIPSVTTSTTLNFNSSSKTGSMTFNNGIKTGYYYTGDSYSALTVSAETGTGIPGTFSVSATKKVFFSKGNLQYQASTGTWRFAENQYDAIGNNAGNNNFTDTRSTQSDWIDLFGWGTSGWNNGNTNYMPDNNWYSSNLYGYGYGPKAKFSINWDLTGDYADADWGVYNTIENGGIDWRTLTGDEWNYLLFTRSASTIGETVNAKYAKSKVNNVCGVIVFPDTYTHPTGVSVPTGINAPGGGGWDSNNYDLNAWGKMEAAGAVFLPVTGRAENAVITELSVGYYWSSTQSASNSNKPYGVKIAASTLERYYYNRYYGYAVRLVKVVEDVE